MAKVGAKTSTKDLLGKVVADYNKLCSVKSHRVGAFKKQLTYNMLLAQLASASLSLVDGPKNDVQNIKITFVRAIGKHYDWFPFLRVEVTSSGLLLQGGGVAL